MPAMQCVRRHDRGDLPQRLTAQAVCRAGSRRRSFVREPQSLPVQLPTQETILGDQIADRLPVATIQPARDDGEEQLDH